MKLFEKIKIDTAKNREREIRFLNIPIIQYGKKEENGIKEKYLELFPKSFEHKTLNRILKFIPQYHDHIWIVRTVGLGEAQLLNFMMDELIKKWDVKNHCFASHRKIYKEMFEMYTNVPFYDLDMNYNDFAPYLKNRNIKYKNKYFHIHHCTIDESLAWLTQHQAGNTTHAIESYKKWAGITEFQSIYPTFLEEIKESALNKIKEINLNIENFVFLAPEANGTEQLPESFWEQLTEQLQNKDFDIFINTVNGMTIYGKSCQLNIAEAAYIASLAKKIIALRCGFAEVLAAIRGRNTLYTLYTPFRSISSKNFLQTYTLKNYPFVEKENIIEFTVNSNNTQEIAKQILKDL